MLTVGIDVGGTNIGVGLVDDQHHVLERSKRDTPQGGPQAIVDAVVELVAALNGEPLAIGLGLPGVINDGRVVAVPNLAGWDESFDTVGMLESRFGMPVALGNDANLGVIGEWVAGAAVGYRNVLGVWMGTGIGGGLILDGRPFGGSSGAAGEVGHVITHHGGALCTCGRRGCVEAYAGRRSLAATAAAMVDAGRHTSLFEIQQDEGKPSLTSKIWARALDEGDEVATELFDMAVDVIAVGIASIVNVLDVDLVVLGGGMAERLGQNLADRIGRAAAPWMLHAHSSRAFAATQLGGDAGIVGAASLARARLINPERPSAPRTTWG